MKFPHLVHGLVVAVLIVVMGGGGGGYFDTTNIYVTAQVVSPTAVLTPYTCGEMGTCQNGIFSMETCGCQCIPPYCPDLMGDCTQPTNSCGGNPWTECVKGVDCRE